MIFLYFSISLRNLSRISRKTERKRLKSKIFSSSSKITEDIRDIRDVPDSASD